MFRAFDLISPGYCDTQRIMHANPKGYGGRGYVWAPTVIEIARRYDVQSILDYGSGRGTMGAALRDAGFMCSDYDPAIPGWDGPPDFADMVISTDVIEHVEPNKLANVLAHIRGLARKVVFLVIACRPANKQLPNGGNAHLIIKGNKWWRARILEAGFTVQKGPSILPAKMPGQCWYGVLTP